MAYTLALTICSTTGRGDAKNRALAGVICRAAGQLGQAEGAGGERNGAQQEQCGDEPPCRTCFCRRFGFLRRRFPDLIG